MHLFCEHFARKLLGIPQLAHLVLQGTAVPQGKWHLCRWHTLMSQVECGSERLPSWAILAYCCAINCLLCHSRHAVLCIADHSKCHSISGILLKCMVCLSTVKRRAEDDEFQQPKHVQRKKQAVALEPIGKNFLLYSNAKVWLFCHKTYARRPAIIATAAAIMRVLLLLLLLLLPSCLCCWYCCHCCCYHWSCCCCRACAVAIIATVAAIKLLLLLLLLTVTVVCHVQMWRIQICLKF